MLIHFKSLVVALIVFMTSQDLVSPCSWICCSHVSCISLSLPLVSLLCFWLDKTWR